MKGYDEKHLDKLTIGDTTYAYSEDNIPLSITRNFEFVDNLSGIFHANIIGAKPDGYDRFDNAFYQEPELLSFSSPLSIDFETY